MNPLSYSLPQQVKAVIGLIAVIVGAVVVSLPDVMWLKILNGAIVAVVGYLSIFTTSNAPLKDTQKGAL